MSYEQFATRYHRYTTTAKSSSEAFRDSTYATGMWRCETADDRARRIIVDISIGLAVFLIPMVVFFYGFYTWVAK
jgi:hypothetical protein